MASPQLTRTAAGAASRAERHATLRAELATAFDAADDGGADVRAFAWEGVTCIVRWKPTRHASVAVDLRVRRGESVAEHAALLPSVAMIARWCEHHVLFFAQDADPRPAPVA